MVAPRAAGRRDPDRLRPGSPALLQSGTPIQGAVRGQQVDPGPSRAAPGPWGEEGARAPGDFPLGATRKSRGGAQRVGGACPKSGGSLQQRCGSSCSLRGHLSATWGSEPPRSCRATRTAAKTKFTVACGRTTPVEGRRAPERPGPSRAASAASVPLALVSGRGTALTITHGQDLPKAGAERPSRTGKNNWKKLFSVKAGLFFLAIMSD